MDIKKKRGEEQVLIHSGEPIIICTYGGMQVFRLVKNISRYMFTGDTVKPSIAVDVGVNKADCLFAVSASGWKRVRQTIKQRAAIKEQGLGAEPRLALREELHKLPYKTPVRVILRNGLVLRGIIVKPERWTILLQIDEQNVLIWKHSVYSIKEEHRDE